MTHGDMTVFWKTSPMDSRKAYPHKHNYLLNCQLLKW